MPRVTWLGRLTAWLGGLVHVPHEDTAIQRARSRNRRAILTSGTNLLAQGTGLVTSLISVPLTIGYLGKERYGLWGAVSALLMWAALADFGMGRGLVNHLSEAYAKGDRAAGGRYVSTAFFSLLGVAALLGLAFVPLLLVVPWDRLFNVRSEAVRVETTAAVAAVVCVFLVNFPLSMVGPVYASYQRGYVANLFRIVGHLLSLAALLIAIQARLSLPWLVAATGGVPLVLSVTNLAYISRDMRWLRPRLKSTSVQTLRELLTVSTPLLLFQVGSLLINELQTLIIARRSGLETVADYSVFIKVYTVPVILLGLIDGPLLPAYREALTRRDVHWLRSTFWRVQGIKLGICAAATLFYVVFGNWATGLLSGQHVRFAAEVWVAASLMAAVGTWNGSFNDLLISTNRLWTLVWFILGNGVVTASLTYLAVQRFGMLGIVVAATVYSLCVTAWIFPILCWRHIAPTASDETLLAAARGALPESRAAVEPQ